jgi:hypothetical protein
VAVADQHPAEQHSNDHTAHPHPADPHAEPSADWGWHGGFPLAGPIIGWFTVFALFMMLVGNHRSHVEDIWLIGLGLVLVVMLVGSHLKSRRLKSRQSRQR